MLSKILQNAISETEKNPHIIWQDPEWSVKVNEDIEFSKYMNNVPISIKKGDPLTLHKKCHGYFALLHNIVSKLPADTTIFELGNI